MASPLLSFGSGLARGLAGAYERHLDRKEQRRQEDRQDKLREFSLLYPKAMDAADLTGDYAAVEDFIGGYFPKTKAETSARRAVAKSKQPTVSPPSLAISATPPVEEQAAPAPTDIGAMMPEPTPPPGMAPAPAPAAAQAPLQNRSQITAGTPAPQPQPSQQFFGFTMPTPAERRQLEVDAEISKLEQTRVAQAALARKILPSLQKDDPSITLEDAMRYVTKGDLMSNASQRGASMYHYGVDREAIAKGIFGKNYEQLDRHEADIVLREEKTLLEQEAQARGTGTAQAKFNAPQTAEQAQATGTPVGTSSAQLAGQVVPTTQEKDRRNSVVELKDSLQVIRDQLLPGALPSKTELAGVAPGLAYAARRRLPQYREKIAALESAINNVVNVMARSVGEQRGTQTERDALRAEAAIAQIHDAILTGDTVESAQTRIDQSLRVLDGILSRLPNKPVPTEKPGAPAPSAAATGGAPATATGPSTAVKQGNAWVIVTPDAAAPTGQPQPAR